MDLKTALIFGSLVFFGIAAYFVMTPGKVIDRIGVYLTPSLIGFLLLIIVLSFVKPLGKVLAPDVETNSFSFGFTSGYQTMDALASIMFGGTVAAAVGAKGYKGKEANKVMAWVALVAGLLISFVYYGLCRIGAVAGSLFLGMEERAAMVGVAVEKLAGSWGIVVLAAIIFLACLTTAVGLLVTASNYFYELFKERFSYKLIAWVLLGASYLISIIGVEGIIKLAAPMLDIAYPVLIVLVLLCLFGKKGCPYRECYIGGVIGALPVALIMAFKYIPAATESMDKILEQVPLGPSGFGSMLPAALGVLLGWVYHVYKSGAKNKTSVSRVEALKAEE